MFSSCEVLFDNVTGPSYGAIFLDMDLTWIKSSLSSGDDCAEIAHLPDGGVAVRNSSHPEEELRYTAEEWDCFLDGARKGEFDVFAR